MESKKRERMEKYAAKGRRYKIVAYNRFFVTAITVLVQFLLYVWLLYSLDTITGQIVSILMTVIAWACVLYLISRTERTYSRLQWIVLILFMPVIGVTMYFLFGEGRPARVMKKRHAQVEEKSRALLQTDEQATDNVRALGRQTAICMQLQEKAKYPVYDDGDVTYYKSGEELFDEMISCVEKAEKYVLIEYFIIAGGYMWDKLRSVLLERAKAGVKVYIIYDDFGSILYLPYKYEKYVEELHPNIRCMVFNRVVPLLAGWMNHRDHRKIFVVDGKVAFTGGINIADEYVDKKRRFGYWKDTGIKVTGSAVNTFTVLFSDHWNAYREDKINVEELLVKSQLERTGNGFYVQPYADSPLDTKYTGASVYLDMIHSANEFLYVFTPYLVLDETMRTAFCLAAERGVDVRIVTPGIPDKKTTYRITRANYQTLLKAGVKIYEYEPGFIHAKSMVSENRAVVGTINCDYRSLYLHFENAVLFGNCAAVDAVKKDAEETFAVSKQINKDDVKKSAFGRLYDSVLRLFETMF